MRSVQVVLGLLPLLAIATYAVKTDPLGYILYCPCMGRFGNQADHFLGVLAFARTLNRTLVLPPWVEYRYGESKSFQVPFKTYFKLEPLRSYHKIVTMEEFMDEIAVTEWPHSQRIAFCYSNRNGKTEKGCNAKEGNPFGPFWDTFNVDFVDSEFYGPLHYNAHQNDVMQQWKEKYPPSKWPVLAFTGAPASFPVQQENTVLQKYLEWSHIIEEKASTFISRMLPSPGAYVGIHLRNGLDWVRACDHIPEVPNLFSAPQCLGYRNEHGIATSDMCLPTKLEIIKKLNRTIIHLHSIGNVVRAVFVASDGNHMIPELDDSLKHMGIRAHRLEQNEPHVDLAILSRSNYFIGNCISSFSAFVKRTRDVHSMPSAFWGWPPEKKINRTSKRRNSQNDRDEL